MLLVTTYLDVSRVSGIGLFAAENILSGTLVWRMDEGFDLCFNEDKLCAMPKWQQEFFCHYCFKRNGMLYYCIDNARFMNHSGENPNIIEKPEGSYAIRDICAGEELTCDYYLLSDLPDDLSLNIFGIQA